MNESFGDLYLKVVDLKQDLSTFGSVVGTRWTLKRMQQHTILHAIQSITTSCTYVNYVKNVIINAQL